MSIHANMQQDRVRGARVFSPCQWAMIRDACTVLLQFEEAMRMVTVHASVTPSLLFTCWSTRCVD